MRVNVLCKIKYIFIIIIIIIIIITEKPFTSK